MTVHTELFDRAVQFAVRAHAGTVRKFSENPYILHPLEAAVIAGTLTCDSEVLAAAVLHDTVEDAAVSLEEIAGLFGDRVAALVASETEDKRRGVSPQSSWQTRKEESLEILKNADDPGVKILWLSDKLSNMRSFDRMRRRGEPIWPRFHQSDASKQAWYYRSVVKYTSALSDTDAWKEFNALTEKLFEGV